MKLKQRIYMDCSATTKTDHRVVEAMLPYYSEVFANASSMHFEGMQARKAVEKARVQVANLINAQAEEIYFTSGGTEADNFAMKGLSRQSKKKHIITSAIEHPAVLQTVKTLQDEGYEISYLAVDSKGLVSIDELKSLMREDTLVVSVMLANNEIGTLQPLREISTITKAAGVFLHTDAIQAVGNMPVDVNDLGVDLLSMSGHKFYGPKGIGALYVRKGVPIMPFMDGGEHEKGKRSGTYNTPGIVGIGKACEIAINEMNDFYPYVKNLRDYMIKKLLVSTPEIYLNGHREMRLPGNVHVSVPYVEGEALLLRIDDAGFAVSTGSACSSHNLKISHTLRALGLEALMAQGSLRISLGRHNTTEEIDLFLNIFPEIVEKLRLMSPLYQPYTKGA